MPWLWLLCMNPISWINKLPFLTGMDLTLVWWLPLMGNSPRLWMLSSQSVEIAGLRIQKGETFSSPKPQGSGGFMRWWVSHCLARTLIGSCFSCRDSLTWSRLKKGAWVTEASLLFLCSALLLPPPFCSPCPPPHWTPLLFYLLSEIKNWMWGYGNVTASSLLT